MVFTFSWFYLSLQPDFFKLQGLQEHTHQYPTQTPQDFLTPKTPCTIGRQLFSYKHLTAGLVIIVTIHWALAMGQRLKTHHFYPWDNAVNCSGSIVLIRKLGIEKLSILLEVMQ